MSSDSLTETLDAAFPKDTFSDILLDVTNSAKYICISLPLTYNQCIFANWFASCPTVKPQF